MKLFNRCGWLASRASLSHQYSLMAGQGVQERGLVADLRQVVFSQTGHFHDGIAVNAVLEHGTAIFRVASRSPSNDLPVFQAGYLSHTLFKLLCDGHKCVSVLRHTLCQFAHKGFGVGCFACLHYIVYQRYHLR
jgi:hypothetical protein